MQRITARIIFLAGVLAQLGYAVKADQPADFYQKSLLGNDFAKTHTTTWPAAASYKELANIFKRTRYRPKADPSVLIPATGKLPAPLSRLKAPKTIDLPNKPSQVIIKELKPLTLKEVEQLLEVNSPQLKASASRVKQAKSLLVAELSRWYPAINLTANGLPEYFSIEQFRNSDFGGDTIGQNLRTSLSLKVQWNLIDPARVPAIAAARDSYEKARNSNFIKLRDLRLETSKRYFFLQQADEGVRIGKESVRASLLSLKYAKARFESGVATRLEVLEAETQLARDKQLLTRKLGDQKNNRRVLAQLLALPANITPIAASPPQVIGLWKASLEESIISAFRFREELKQLLLDISISNSKANQALASSQPTISIVNTLGYSYSTGQQGVAASSDVDMDDYSWNVNNTIGLNATWQLFDGGKASSLYRYNKYKAKEGEANFASKRDSIRREVENSFFNLRTANQNIATTTREVLAAREALRLARLRFKAGVTTQREVVNNQRDLTQAEVSYSNAITSYNTNLAQLRRTTGIDHVKACKAKKIKPKRPENAESIDLPIEPFPLIPACQATTISKKG